MSRRFLVFWYHLVLSFRTTCDVIGQNARVSYIVFSHHLLPSYRNTIVISQIEMKVCEYLNHYTPWSTSQVIQREFSFSSKKSTPCNRQRTVNHTTNLIDTLPIATWLFDILILPLLVHISYCVITFKNSIQKIK